MKTHPSDMFAAVFSQKSNVSTIRLATLRLLSASETGEMKFGELLRNIQSSRERTYSSQKLTYDLQVLKESGLVDQTSQGSYSVTKYGSYILDLYTGIERELSGNAMREKPGFVGVVTGTIIASEFDHQLFGEELCKIPVFKRTLSVEENKIRLEYKDEDKDFDSEVEISDDGSFASQVIIYEDIPNIEESFMEDLAKTAKTHRMAEAFAHVMLYYIERTARRLWRTAEVRVALGPDSYPLNIYIGEK